MNVQNPETKDTDGTKGLHEFLSGNKRFDAPISLVLFFRSIDAELQFWILDEPPQIPNFMKEFAIDFR